jgi:hypothetical protein
MKNKFHQKPSIRIASLQVILGGIAELQYPKYL